VIRTIFEEIEADIMEQEIGCQRYCCDVKIDERKRTSRVVAVEKEGQDRTVEEQVWRGHSLLYVLNFSVARVNLSKSRRVYSRI
jgi:hypothetical protein